MLRLISGDSEAVIYEEGAYLYALRRRGVDVLLRGDLSRKTRGGMAVLIPYANRVKGGVYEIDGVLYELPKNEEGNAIHGLVMDKTWRVAEAGPDAAVLELELEHSGYPSRLSCRVSYALRPGALEVAVRVRNMGPRRAPLTVGAHPYFLVEGPWRIRAQGAMRCVALNKIPTGGLEPHEFGEGGEYDDCFLIEQDPVVLESRLSRIVLARRNMPYVQIYTGVKGAVAVEPMSGAPDAYHNGMGLRILAPGEEAEYGFVVEFELK
ncbi:MAG: aldose 1-epimerase [Thermoproteus sp. AZ2]|uniref:Aldose 1-epimerase n=1 Tax=Thermoproteus sp. AZ2 TaxID=1609232 RepID=A0ACC6V3M1_9CREN